MAARSSRALKGLARKAVAPALKADCFSSGMTLAETMITGVIRKAGRLRM
jgi:hypothetical protein